MAKIRIQKWIASGTDLSRRKAEEAIEEGRVRLNGQIVREQGVQADPAIDHLELDGQQVSFLQGGTVIILNKPRRVMTTKFDPEGRETVMNLLPPEYSHVFPVGRLDYDSEGLLLLTDDGILANEIAHPSQGVTKTYWARVEGYPHPQTIQKLMRSVELEEGPGKFDKVRILDKGREDHALLELEVSEGRNRFIRRMLEAVNHPVRRLQRIKIGALELGTLEAGHYEITTSEDLRKRLKSASNDRSRPANPWKVRKPKDSQ